MNQFDIFMYPLLDLFVFLLFLGGVDSTPVGVESMHGSKERRSRVTGAGLRHHQQDDSPTALRRSSLR